MPKFCYLGVTVRKTYSTREVAKLLGITTRTLYRWLYSGKLPEPRMISVGRLKARVWTKRDVEKARRLVGRQRSRTLRRVLTNWRAPGPIGKAKGAASPQYVARAATRIEARQPRELKDKPQPKFVGQFQPEDEILTPSELAKRLKVPVTWVYEQTRLRTAKRSRETLPHRKMGKYLRFSWPEVVAWLNRLSAAQG